MRRVYRESDDLSGVEIDNGGNIHESSLKPDVREISRPDMTLVRWRGREKNISFFGIRRV